MKKIILTLTPFLLAAILWFVAVPNLINAKLETHFKSIGFENAIIGKTDISPHRIKLQSIQLDNDAKTRIKTINIGASPYALIMGKQIDGILIDGLTSQISVATIRAGLQKSEAPSFLKLIDVPAENIEIKNFKIVMPTGQTVQNITGHIHVKATETSEVKIVSGILENLSAIASVSTSVKGKIDPKGNGVLNFDISKVSLNTPFMDINRANGWVSYTKETDSTAQLAGQIDAGAGSLLKTAAKNISLILGRASSSDDNINIVLRAQAAGVEGVNLSTDMTFSRTDQEISVGQSVIEAKEFGDFLRYLKKTHSADILSLPELFALKDTKIAIRYLSEKRFADGPLPFDLQISSQQQDIMTGTFLIYPNDLQIRGSAETNPRLTNDIKSLLSLSDDKVSDNIVRLDGNLKDAIF